MGGPKERTWRLLELQRTTHTQRQTSIGFMVVACGEFGVVLTAWGCGGLPAGCWLGGRSAGHVHVLGTVTVITSDEQFMCHKGAYQAAR